MFQLEDINAAHARVKSGADFPAYVQDLIKLGVSKYHTYVSDGHALFEGENSYQVLAGPQYAALQIAAAGNAEKFNHYLKIHQQGQTDYSTFCSHCAETGIEKWTVNLALLTCTYYDPGNRIMLEEKIPTP